MPTGTKINWGCSLPTTEKLTSIHSTCCSLPYSYPSQHQAQRHTAATGFSHSPRRLLTGRGGQWQCPSWPTGLHDLDALPPRRRISNKQLPCPSWADTLVSLLFRINFSISARSAEPSRGMTVNVWNNLGSTAILTRLSSSSWTWGIFPFI